MVSDIEIAQAACPQLISEVAQRAGIPEQALEPYGRYKAKIRTSDLLVRPRKARMVLVTAINPTPAGEGKTTTSVGLADALAQLDKNVILCLREPSLGPVFGVKGGAAGGGYAQVIPMEDINLHFTGDFHAISAANNLCAAMIDNHIKQGNELGIDPERVSWHRCVDMNDRQLRHVVDGLGSAADGVTRQDSFDITVASEVMAAFCLASDLLDLRARLARMVVAQTYEGDPVTVADLKAEGAMTALLRDAVCPNLVQTLEGTPALVHGGPFANIAHGCNSVIATDLGLRLADWVVTEAGFGADLGAEKFLDIKCRALKEAPAVVVVVATIRALKLNGGASKETLATENLTALEAGLPNLMRHIHNVRDVWHLPVVVAINAFPSDTATETELVRTAVQELGVRCEVSQVHAQGGAGGRALAQAVVATAEQAESVGQVSSFTPAYYPSDGILSSLEAVAQRIYGADGVDLTSAAERQLDWLQAHGFGQLPVCIAKTQYSFSDDPMRLGAPTDFRLTVRELRIAAGAGFVVALTGTIMTMPGLPKRPAAERIDVTADGRIVGLF